MRAARITELANLIFSTGRTAIRGWRELTGSILASANLNELLDIVNLLWHFGGIFCTDLSFVRSSNNTKTQMSKIGPIGFGHVRLA